MVTGLTGPTPKVRPSSATWCSGSTAASPCRRNRWRLGRPLCDRPRTGDQRRRDRPRRRAHPGRARPDDLTVALVSKWERALRRLERLPAVTIAVADGDCGGPALDALLATDYRIGRRGAAAGTRRGRGDLAGHGPVPARAAGGRGPRSAGPSCSARPSRPPTRWRWGSSTIWRTTLSLAAAQAMDVAAAAPGAELAIRRQLMLEAHDHDLRGRARRSPGGLRPGAADGRRRSQAVTGTARGPRRRPRGARDLAAASRLLADTARRADDLLASLPEPGLRSPDGQPPPRRRRKPRARAMRARFLDVHADAVYQQLTEGRRATCG